MLLVEEVCCRLLTWVKSTLQACGAMMLSQQIMFFLLPVHYCINAIQWHRQARFADYTVNTLSL